jgi:hypothetical protein
MELESERKHKPKTKENQMSEKIKVGTKVTGNWGAMHPTSEGEVVTVEAGGVEILWNDETEVDYVHLTSIHPKGYRSANGSGIGIFTK